MHCWVALAVVSGVAAATEPARAQVLPPSPTGFQILAYEEKWDDRATAGVSASLKDIALDAEGSVRLDLGGTLRERVEARRNPLFSLPQAAGVEHDGYWLHRFLVNANLHVGSNLRVFVQGENALESGRSPMPLATDRNHADLAQAFVEMTARPGGVEVGVRGGRQEMLLGSGRLVDIREGPNIRQRFDGVRGWAGVAGAKLDVFWTRPVDNRRGMFDDRSDPRQSFYGGYFSAPIRPSSPVKIDLYAYRAHREGAVLDAGRADERRNTVGVRLSLDDGALDFDFEAVRQTGRFGAREIDAYALFFDTGLNVAFGGMKTRLALKADVASGGDSRGTGDLGTFHPLFPKLDYFNQAGIQTFANYVDMFPYVTVQPRRGLGVLAGVSFQWREDTRDGFYQPGTLPIVAGNANGRSYLGEAMVVQVEWQATPNLNLSASAVGYLTGNYLQAAGARDQGWAGVWATFRF